MATKYEQSKTYQYRKVMKPLLERKRRARINKCLDELKDLVGECVQQQSGDPNAKFEKADILELTVQHLRQLKTAKQQQSIGGNSHQSFRSGYIQAANEVSCCLASMPNISVTFGTKLMTHLGLRLNQLEADSQPSTPTAIHVPLSINCATSGSASVNKAMYSPVSSGYASDSDYSQSSLTPSSTASTSPGLLQVAPSMWRPWLAQLNSLDCST